MVGKSEHQWVWRDDAACRGVAEAYPNLFWSDDPKDIERALAYCEGCSVRKECSEARGPVFDDVQFIWGGVRL